MLALRVQYVEVLLHAVDKTSSAGNSLALACRRRPGAYVFKRFYQHGAVPSRCISNWQAGKHNPTLTGGCLRSGGEGWNGRGECREEVGACLLTAGPWEFVTVRF